MSEHITLSAPDISCGHCVATVQKTVNALRGVESVKASEQTKLVDITFDPAQLNLAQISEALNDAGYPVAQP